MNQLNIFNTINRTKMLEFYPQLMETLATMSTPSSSNPNNGQMTPSPTGSPPPDSLGASPSIFIQVSVIPCPVSLLNPTILSPSCTLLSPLSKMLGDSPPRLHQIEHSSQWSGAALPLQFFSIIWHHAPDFIYTISVTRTLPGLLSFPSFSPTS